MTESSSYRFGNTDVNAGAHVLMGNYQGATLNIGYHQMTDTLKQCRDALFLTNPEHDRAALITQKGERVDGTCVWIKNEDAYKSWRNGDTRPLWIKGGPAKGKSMVSIFLTQDLEREADARKGHNVVYFFCVNNDPRRNNASAVMRGLLWQMTGKNPQLSKHLKQHLDISEKVKYTLETREALWDIFVELLTDSERDAMFCLLDGLDEMDEDSQGWLLPKLSSVGDIAFANDFKLILVSRPDLLSLKRSEGRKKLLSLDLDAENKRKDIQKFLVANVNELEQCFRDEGFTPEVREEVEQRLLKVAENTFLYIGFAMHELKEQKTIDDVLEKLEGFPKGLDAFYERMLLQIEHRFRSTGLRILRWVAMAFRPLTLSEFADAINIQPSKLVTKEQSMKSHVSKCGPLVTIKDGTVVFVHQSAKDYLTRTPDPTGDPMESFWIGTEEAHSALASDCIAYVQRVIDRPGRASAPRLPPDRIPTHKEWEEWDAQYKRDLWSPDLQECPYYDYAVTAWPEHAILATIHADYLNENGRFFKELRLLRGWWYSYRFASRSGIPTSYRVPNIFSRVWNPESTELHLACFLGIEEWVKLLLCRVDADVNAKDACGLTPLHLVALYGHKEIVVALLATSKVEVDCKDLSGITPLAFAAQQGHTEVVRVLLATGKVEADRKIYQRTTPLHSAAREGHARVVKLLLDTGEVDAAWKDKYGYTPLHHAAKKGYLEVVEMLLATGEVDVNCKDKKGEPLLCSVAGRGHKKVIELLLATGKVDDVDCKDEEGMTPLYWAARIGHLAHTGDHKGVVELLLATGKVDVSMKEKGEADGRARLPLSFNRARAERIRAKTERWEAE